MKIQASRRQAMFLKNLRHDGQGHNRMEEIVHELVWLLAGRPPPLSCLEKDLDISAFHRQHGIIVTSQIKKFCFFEFSGEHILYFF